jgi:hypothetical protein
VRNPTASPLSRFGAEKLFTQAIEERLSLRLSAPRETVRFRPIAATQPSCEDV